VRARLPDIARECEEKESRRRTARAQYASMGFLGINVPEKYGGLGLETSALLVLEEFRRISSAVAFRSSSHASVRARDRAVASRPATARRAAVCRGDIRSRCRCRAAGQFRADRPHDAPNGAATNSC
jgi:alkylation response protein AidB-like acyl-CoA dehydrogenase